MVSKSGVFMNSKLEKYVTSLFKSKTAFCATLIFIVCLLLGILQVYLKVLDGSNVVKPISPVKDSKDTSNEKSSNIPFSEVSLSFKTNDKMSKERINRLANEEIVLPPSYPPAKMLSYASPYWTNQQPPLIELLPTSVCSLDPLNDYALDYGYSEYMDYLSQAILHLSTLEHIAKDYPELEARCNKAKNNLIECLTPAIIQLARKCDSLTFKRQDTLESITKHTIEDIRNAGLNKESKNEEFKKNFAWIFNQKYEINEAVKMLEQYEEYAKLHAQTFPQNLKNIMNIHPAVIKCDIPHIFEFFCKDNQRNFRFFDESLKVTYPVPFYWNYIDDKSQASIVYSCIRDGVAVSESCFYLNDQILKGDTLDNLLAYIPKNYYGVTDTKKEYVGKNVAVTAIHHNTQTKDINETIKKFYYPNGRLPAKLDRTIYITFKLYFFVCGNKCYRIEFSTAALSKEEADARMKRNLPLFEQIAKSIKFETIK